MTQGKIISLSKRMVKEHFNRHVVRTDDVKKITVKDVNVMNFEDKPDSYKLILSVLDVDKLYYGITYDKNKDEVHSYIYEKDDFRLIGRKENNEKVI